jgi:hypothetical protein
MRAQPEAERVRFSLGGLEYEVSGVPQDWWPELPERLSRCTVPVHARPAGQLIFTKPASLEALRPPPEGHDLHQTSRMDYAEQAVVYTSDWCRGVLELSNPPRMSIDCHIEAGPWFHAVFENLLRLTVAYDVLGRGGLLLHAAGIVIDNGARVLFGHSGAGKSTSSTIAMRAGHTVISDDIVVLMPAEKGWEVRKVPFCGTTGGTMDAQARYPLAGLYHLHQSETNRVVRYSPATAAAALCGAVYQPGPASRRNPAGDRGPAAWDATGTPSIL